MKYKGFTLIEILVALVIISILTTVGVITYNGYATAAKQNVSKIIHSKTVRFLSAEITLCSLLDDSTIMDGKISCGYQEGDWNGCNTDDCKAQMIIDEVDVFEDKNPYDKSERAVTAIESDLGYTVVYNRTDHLEIKTQWDKNKSTSPLINYIYFDGTMVAMTGTSGPDEPTLSAESVCTQSNHKTAVNMINNWLDQSSQNGGWIGMDDPVLVPFKGPNKMNFHIDGEHAVRPTVMFASMLNVAVHNCFDENIPGAYYSSSVIGDRLGAVELSNKCNGFEGKPVLQITTFYGEGLKDYTEIDMSDYDIHCENGSRLNTEYPTYYDKDKFRGINVLDPYKMYDYSKGNHSDFFITGSKFCKAPKKYPHVNYGRGSLWHKSYGHLGMNVYNEASELYGIKWKDDDNAQYKEDPYDSKFIHTQTRIGRSLYLPNQKIDWSYLSDRCDTYKQEAEKYAEGKFSSGNYCSSWVNERGQAICRTYNQAVPDTSQLSVWDED